MHTSYAQQSRIFPFKSKVKNIVVEIVSMLYILLYLYTGISKLLDQETFIDQLSASEFLEHFSLLIAWVLPITEITIAILLFLPKTRLVGFYASISLMSAFTIYISIILLFSEEQPCSCGGIIELLSWPAHLILNIIFIALAALSITLMKLKNNYTLNNRV